jgi:hypothetical protein
MKEQSISVTCAKLVSANVVTRMLGLGLVYVSRNVGPHRGSSDSLGGQTLVTPPFEGCYKITNLPLCVCRERINVVQE